MRNSLRGLVSGTLVCLALLAGCQTRTGERGTNDGALSAAVKVQLAQAIPALNTITIEVHQGKVQLDGTVESEAEKEQATQAARQVAGVREVVNNLRVTPKGAAG
jgi:osmotically-inducible protein OsmY